MRASLTNMHTFTSKIHTNLKLITIKMCKNSPFQWLPSDPHSLFHILDCRLSIQKVTSNQLFYESPYIFQTLLQPNVYSPVIKCYYKYILFTRKAAFLDKTIDTKDKHNSKAFTLKNMQYITNTQHVKNMAFKTKQKLKQGRLSAPNTSKL